MVVPGLDAPWSGIFSSDVHTRTQFNHGVATTACGLEIEWRRAVRPSGLQTVPTSNCNDVAELIYPGGGRLDYQYEVEPLWEAGETSLRVRAGVVPVACSRYPSRRPERGTMYSIIFLVLFLIGAAAVAFRIRRVFRLAYSEKLWRFPAILALSIGASQFVFLLATSLSSGFYYESSELAFAAGAFMGLMLIPLADVLFLIWAARRHETEELRAEIHRLRNDGSDARQ